MKGIILKAISGFYYVDSGSEIVECKARGRFRREKLTPLVGDYVEFSPLGPNKGILEDVLPRKNKFFRPAVANIDQMVIVVSAASPRTDPFLIDRVGVICELKDCEMIVCVNKCDLDHADVLCSIYQDAGFRVVLLSAETGEGIEALIPLITGKISAFTGNSGVGKSSILNALEPGFHLKVGEMSQKLGRGKHTTRHVELYRLSCGAIVADTPGFSAFDAETMDWSLKENLSYAMREFRPFLGQCRYTDCSHTKERDCAILEAVAQGKIGSSRHASYLRLYELMKDRKEWEL